MAPRARRRAATSGFVASVARLGTALTEDHYLRFRDHPEILPQGSAPGDEGVRDYYAGMTDHFAISVYARHFLPRPWRAED